MTFCPRLIRHFCLKWRRFIITFLFGMVFIIGVIKDVENNQVNDYLEKNNNLDKKYKYYNIDMADSKLFQIITDNAKDKALENSILKMTKKERSLNDTEINLYGKLYHPSVINEEETEMLNNGKSHSGTKSIFNKSLSTNNHFCTVSPNIPPLLKQRRDHAIAACKRLKKQLPKRWRMRHIRWGKQLNIVYCHVPKAASTTWSWHLLRAIGLKDDIINKSDSIHNLLKKQLPYPSIEEAKKGLLDSALKFLVTRHPFERLVSAYQNKIADPLVEDLQYRKVQKQILSKYYGDLPIASQPVVPSFRDFCRYVIDELEEWMHDSDKNGLNPPDHHWSPQTYICSPCKLKYDVFSDTSTLDWDTAYIAQQCGLEDVIKVDVQLNQSPLKPVRLSSMNAPMNTNNILLEKNLNHSAENKNGTNVVELKENIKEKNNIHKDYFNELNSREIKHLHHLYRFDFEIFGYDVHDYLAK